MRNAPRVVRRGLRSVVCGALALSAVSASALAAQTVVVEGPPGPTLPSLTPQLTVRAFGFGPIRPLRVTLQVVAGGDFALPLAVDTTVLAADSVVVIAIRRPLPSEAQVSWRALVQGASQPISSPVYGPRAVPAWLTLISPNSPTGDPLDDRRPQFTWRSARVDAAVGPWTYELQVTTNKLSEQAVAGLLDTTFRFSTNLQANTSYAWNVRASLPGGASIRVASAATFLITDPLLPTTTLLFQNFPNPFPSQTSFSTCFWFDIGGPGATVTLDVLDVRGNLVKTIIPGTDGVRTFAAGRYGRGLPGGGNNCDNRFVWDGTANDGRSVAPGVYLARFQADRGLPTFRRMLFRGR